MLTFYLCFLAGGAVIPLVSLITGTLNSGSDAELELGADMNSDLDAGTEFNVDADADVAIDMNDDVVGDIVMDVPENSNKRVDHTISIGFFPTSLLSISSLAITFGAVGGVMTLAGRGHVITFVIAVFSGYAMSVVVQTIMNSLKRAQSRNNSIDENELMLYDGTIIDIILPGQLGSVSFVTLNDERVSYPARCADKTLRLETGKVVKVLEFQNGIFIVEPKNKYE